MGFRSTFTTSDYPISWPAWFREKYQDRVYVPESGTLCSKHESKAYGVFKELPQDIQRAIDWEKTDKNEPLHFILVFLHECGGITRVEITRNAIVYTEPDGWVNVSDDPDGMTHWYCYGCSDARKAHTPVTVEAKP